MAARAYRPFDLLTLAYTLLVFGLLALWGRHLPRRLPLAAFHLGAFLFVRLAVPWLRRQPCRPLRFLAEVYPLLLFTFFYCQANLANTLFFAAPFDPFFRRLDRTLFGVEPSFWLHRVFGSPLLDEVLHACYFSYYVEIPAIALILYARRRVLYGSYLAAVCLTFYVSYLTFIVLPVHGPHPYRGDEYRGFLFVPLMDAIYAAAETGGGAFPSSHVAVALVALLYARRYGRGLFRFWLPLVAGLAVATVYCRYHYAVDTLGGLLWGLLWYRVAMWLVPPP